MTSETGSNLLPHSIVLPVVMGLTMLLILVKLIFHVFLQVLVLRLTDEKDLFFLYTLQINEEDFQW